MFTLLTSTKEKQLVKDFRKRFPYSAHQRFKCLRSSDSLEGFICRCHVRSIFINTPRLNQRQNAVKIIHCNMQYMFLFLEPLTTSSRCIALYKGATVHSSL